MGAFSLVLPLGRGGLILLHLPGGTTQGASVERWGWDWVDWGLPCSLGLAPSWPENLQKVESLKPSHPHCKAAPCWLLL